MAKETNTKTAAKTGIIRRPGQHLKKPDFGNDVAASRVWDWAIRVYKFEAADRMALIMFCQCWSCYQGEHEAIAKSEGKERKLPSDNAYKWFGALYKMLISLGMTPAQRGKLSVPPQTESLYNMDGGDGSEFPDDQ